MSELREAAQAVINRWYRLPGDNDRAILSDLFARLRAALAQPEAEAEPVAWLHHAQVGDGGDGRTLSFSPDYYPSRASRGIGVVRKTIAVVPLYAHPPRDEWRPASEPPEDGRDVVVWMNDGGHGCFAIGHCLHGEWSPNYVGSPVAHWRDVTPPTEGAK